MTEMTEQAMRAENRRELFRAGVLSHLALLFTFVYCIDGRQKGMGVGPHIRKTPVALCFLSEGV